MYLNISYSKVKKYLEQKSSIFENVNENNNNKEISYFDNSPLKTNPRSRSLLNKRNELNSSIIF